LATTEYPFLRYLGVYPELFKNVNCDNNCGASSIKSLITCNENGNVTVKENKCGRGKTGTYLP
jgi:hypothetical protein